jgi:hypothetical protein
MSVCLSVYLSVTFFLETGNPHDPASLLENIFTTVGDKIIVEIHLYATIGTETIVRTRYAKTGIEVNGGSQQWHQIRLLQQ